MLSERFILIGLTFKNIFSITHPFTKFLQGKNIDLLAAINYTQSILVQIKNIRKDQSFESILLDKDKFIQSKIDDFSFILLTHTRARRIKKMIGEIASDEQISSPIDQFRIKSFYFVIDIVINQITQRFNEDSTPLFKDISLFQRKKLKEIADDNSKMPVDAFEGLKY